MKYVACYCRVSTDEQARFGFSIQAQKDALIKYCKENNYKYELYIDEGISASSMKKRKALNEMLSHSNVFDIILFTKLDRLSRNVLDANTINKLLIENKCTMKAIDEDDIDTSTADGTFIFNLKVSLAQREIEKTSERIQFVFKNKREKGEVTSGSKKYGYNIVDKKFQINQTESENIVNLYNHFIEVNGDMSETYKYFIKHFSGKGKDALYYYLRDTAYIGKYKLYRKNEYVENYIPRIMNDELFYSAQDLLVKKEKNNCYSKDISLFSGIIHCAICKCRMCKKQDNRVKKRIIRYCCDKSYRKKVGSLDYQCSNKKLIREDFIESYLINNLKLLAKNYINQNTIISSEKNTDNSKKIKEIEKKLVKLKDLYLDDLINKNTYKKDYANLQKELSNLSSEKKYTRQRDFSKIKKLLNLDIVNIYNSLTMSEKRTFWLSIVDTIYVDNNEIKEVIFL